MANNLDNIELVNHIDDIKTAVIPSLLSRSKVKLDSIVKGESTVYSSRPVFGQYFSFKGEKDVPNLSSNKRVYYGYNEEIKSYERVHNLDHYEVDIAQLEQDTFRNTQTQNEIKAENNNYQELSEGDYTNETKDGADEMHQNAPEVDDEIMYREALKVTRDLELTTLEPESVVSEPELNHGKLSLYKGNDGNYYVWSQDTRGKLGEFNTYTEALNLYKEELNKLGETPLKDSAFAKFTSDPNIDYTKQDDIDIRKAINSALGLSKLGGIDLNGEFSIYRRKDVVDAVATFSNYTADYKNLKNNRVKVTFSYITPPKRNEQHKIATESIDNNISERTELYKRIRVVIEGLLNEIGLGVGALTELEERKGIQGVFDPEVLNNVGQDIKNLVIRVATGVNGDAALPEEYGHLVEAGLRHDPLVIRLTNYIAQNPDVLEAIFNIEGKIEGLDAFEHYSNMYGQNEPKMLREAVGKLIGRSIIQNVQAKLDVEKSKLSIIHRLLNNIKNLFNRLTKNVNLNKYEKALIQADKMAGELATSLVDARLNMRIDVNNIIDKDQLFKVQAKTDRYKTIFGDMVKNQIKRLFFINQNWDERDVEESLGQYVDITELKQKFSAGEYGPEGNYYGEIRVLEMGLEQMRNLWENKIQSLFTVEGVPQNDIQEIAKVLVEMKSYAQS